MSRVLSTITAGWLLVTHYGGNIAWYETKEDCEIAAQYPSDTAECVPDRFAVEEIRAQETKP